MQSASKATPAIRPQKSTKDFDELFLLRKKNMRKPLFEVISKIHFSFFQMLFEQKFDKSKTNFSKL